MKRLLDSNWKRLGLQVGLLAGIGLAFAIGSQGDEATAGPNPDCPSEGDCTFKKPNIMFIMDYSTSMNTLWDMQNNLTRWEVTVAAVQQIVQPNSFLSQNTHLALMRFGHDPNGQANTPIPGDQSGLIDGHKIDVFWDDDNNVYYPCNGQALIDALNGVPAPMNGAEFGIGTWTKGALDAVLAQVNTNKADHPDDQVDPARAYVNVLLTDGAWTSQNGLEALAPPNQNPAIPAATMFDQQDIPTYVVAVAGDPAAEMAADETAAAGGTMAAIDGDTPDLLAQALSNVVQTIIESVVAPECVGGLPRVMVLLDASSSMLNINMGSEAGGMGETGWDQARAALSAQMGSLFDLDVGIGSVEDVTHLGLAVFGHNAPNPGEQKILVNYGPCMKDNFAWALDPVTSCDMPGCDDPWGGPPISWSFKDGQADPPGFDHPTESHMPQCGGNDPYCVGSGTYTHLGLQLIKNNQAAYHAAAQMMGAEYPTNGSTIYFNILITDGQYNMYSTNAQVEAELEQMYNNGLTTYVIGFGDGLNSPAAMAQLTNMADWGSGGNEPYFDANNQADLEAALAAIFGGLVFDPCCAFNDCSVTPEPTGNEPDPVPMTTTGDGDGDTGDGDGDTGDGDGDGDPGDGDGDPGDGDGDPGDGDGDPSTGDGDGDTNGETFGDDGETGDSGTETGGGIIGVDDGCNCSTADTDAGKTRGLLGTFLALGSLFAHGLVRRRRK
jgi:MYXO-CTERM domain-containing protein